MTGKKFGVMVGWFSCTHWFHSAISFLLYGFGSEETFEVCSNVKQHSALCTQKINKKRIEIEIMENTKLVLNK